MLTPVPTVPHAVDGEVIGIDGSKVWPVLVDSTLTLWVSRQGDMQRAQLDAAGVDALRVLLDDAAGRMAAELSSDA